LTHTRAELAAMLEHHGLRPRRSLGQNFVADPNTVRRIARISGVGPGDRVVEVGAGLGSLTWALAETGAQVTAVEADPRLVEALLGQGLPPNVQVVAGDAMALDWGSLLAEDKWALVANLPYNLATPLVVSLLEGVPAIGRMLVLVQLEVAQRLVARAGEPAYGAVSVKVSYWATARLAGRVPKEVFLPRPKVESALVALERRPAPPVPPGVAYPELAALVGAGFAQRRKMLRRSLAGLVAPEVFELAGVAPEARAEDLDVSEWGKLARWARLRSCERRPS
jgi:16S rRNA (adenine1518-N6/adenine1519-N6)-dimethyltransferase